MDIVILYVCILCILPLTSTEKAIVETTHGKVQGKILKTLLKNEQYYGFMGIPFAEPPINDLKFLPPQPIKPWEDVLIATKDKQACIQYNRNVLKSKLGIYGAEDCLYLDVFTPELDDKMRSVIVFIYNDHFINSYNKTKHYSPDFFIEEDVVIVTISHRLSLFGFLYLDDDIVPGNAGLKDIVVALEWIKTNLRRFGGDPNKVTLMGSRGGAAAVDLLMQSSAKHLFQSAILQGGTSWESAYLQEDIPQRAFKLTELLDRPSPSNSVLLNDLKQISIEDLFAKEFHANPQDYFKENQRSLLTFGPIVEKQVNGLVTEYPEDSTESINIPIMIGFNSREGLLATLLYLNEPRYLSYVQKDFPFLMPRRLRFSFDPREDSYYKAVEEIKKYYFKKGRVTMKDIPSLANYFGDVLTGYAMNQALKKYSERTSKQIYYYYFDYVSDLNENKKDLMKLSTVEEGTWGAVSGDELCYLFYCPGLKPQYLNFNKTMSEEINIQKKIVRLWSNFAKFGNPTPDGDASLDGLQWPAYDIKQKNYLHINEKIEVKSDICKDSFQFWDNILEKWQQLAVNGTVIYNVNKKDEL
ncbi:hypothetical protein ACJJTC_006883 [Scirpophaga incertulas]